MVRQVKNSSDLQISMYCSAYRTLHEHALPPERQAAEDAPPRQAAAAAARRRPPHPDVLAVDERARLPRHAARHGHLVRALRRSGDGGAEAMDAFNSDDSISVFLLTTPAGWDQPDDGGHGDHPRRRLQPRRRQAGDGPLPPDGPDAPRPRHQARGGDRRREGAPGGERQAAAAGAAVGPDSTSKKEEDAAAAAGGRLEGPDGRHPARVALHERAVAEAEDEAEAAEGADANTTFVAAAEEEAEEAAEAALALAATYEKRQFTEVAAEAAARRRRRMRRWRTTSRRRRRPWRRRTTTRRSRRRRRRR